VHMRFLGLWCPPRQPKSSAQAAPSALTLSHPALSSSHYPALQAASLFLANSDLADSTPLLRAALMPSRCSGHNGCEEDYPDPPQ
jgi:hypothetical protein